MKAVRIGRNCMAIAVLCGMAALGATPTPVESTAVAKMESRTKDTKRDPGIFGDYWWANRFLSRHQLVE